MESRHVPRLDRSLSVVGLGCWQLGADWGDVTDDDALATLDAALDAGVTFLDTADVYGDGRSEHLISESSAARRGDVFVATKVGRRADPLSIEQFSAENLRAWVDRSRSNLAVDTLDLVQLHCPPTPVYSSDAVFDVMDALVADGAVKAYGVSVETCDEALTAIARPGVATVQIILNAFRLKPLEQVLPAAQEAGVGIIARVPLASGLLSGRYDASTTFAADDHRTYNRDGSAFDVGETFAGVPFEAGLRAVEDLRDVAGERPMAEFALRWVIDTPGVTAVIPGARNPDQARRNAAVAGSAPLTDAQRADVAAVYDRHVRDLVHARW
ncbi:aldo/keto reductase [Aquipuribacter sp. MA13-6]|uniref:aldo/keto reductase n=1 Tax=unclassified Aquipuribacter TaxID=2635084 RepID=UPI003EECCEBE